jgi:hypothetical protein
MEKYREISQTPNLSIYELFDGFRGVSKTFLSAKFDFTSHSQSCEDV